MGRKWFILLLGVLLSGTSILLIVVYSNPVDQFQSESDQTHRVQELREEGTLPLQESVIYYKNTIYIEEGDTFNLKIRIDDPYKDIPVSGGLIDVNTNEWISLFENKYLSDPYSTSKIIKQDGQYVVYVYGESEVPSNSFVIQISFDHNEMNETDEGFIPLIARSHS